MSKPVTDVEIEDVLSSIRRLVTQGERVPAPRGDAADRLVLTPSLRVAGAPAKDAEAGPAAEEVSDPTPVESVPDAEAESSPAEAVSHPLDLTAFRAQRARKDHVAPIDDDDDDDAPAHDVDALLARLAQSGAGAELDEEDEAEDEPEQEMQAATAAEVARILREEDEAETGDSAWPPRDPAEAAAEDDPADDSFAEHATQTGEAEPFSADDPWSGASEDTSGGEESWTTSADGEDAAQGWAEPEGPDVEQAEESEEIEAALADPADAPEAASFSHRTDPVFSRAEDIDDEPVEATVTAPSPWDDTATPEADDVMEAKAASGEDPLPEDVTPLPAFAHRSQASDLDDPRPAVEAASRPTPFERPFRSDRMALESTIAELEAAVRDEDAFEPDGSERNPVMDWTSAETSAGFFTSRLRRQAAPETVVADDAAPGDDAVAIAEAGDASPTAQATPEEADTDTALVLETPEAEEMAGDETPELRVAEEADPELQHDQSPEPVAPDEAENSVLPDDELGRPEAEDAARAAPGEFEEVTISLPDAEILRQIVAEVLREELAGELGTRITGNVRRLVRREVSRALNVDTPLD